MSLQDRIRDSNTSPMWPPVHFPSSHFYPLASPAPPPVPASTMKLETSLLGVLALTDLTSVFAGVGQEFNLQQTNVTQAMDMYVFAYSWQPEFCYGKTGYYGCSNPLPSWSTNFTLHGLWPQYSSGGYPSYCTTEPFDPSVPDKVGWTDMTTYWPNAQYATTDPKYDDFWEHEWTKHGYAISLCFLLSSF